ncbi:MAG: transposase [Bacillota bacterium]
MQVLKVCAEAGLVKVGVVALDGTKVKGMASLSANRKYEAIREEVERMLFGQGGEDFCAVGVGRGDRFKKKRRRKPNPAEFRARAVELVRTSGKSIPEIARELGISGEGLRN